MKLKILLLLGILICGCGRKTPAGTSMEWRSDHKPITSRYKGLDGIATLTWNCELLSRPSGFVPGKSAFRIRCFAENFSNTGSNSISFSDLQPTTLPADVVFPVHLNAASTSVWFSSQTIDNAIFTFRYHGKAFYAPDIDLLYFDSSWE